MKRVPAPLRKILPILLVAVTAGAFIYLFTNHPQYWHTLIHTDFRVLGLLLVLYACMLACVAWTYDVAQRMCGRRLPQRENILLTCYTSITNFFGPLQSGVGVRAAYLKTRLGLKLRDFTLATFTYYAAYAVTSAVFILIGSGRHWPIALALLAAVTFGCTGILYIVHKRVTRSGKSEFRLTPLLGLEMVVATFLQLAFFMLIYWVELLAVHTHANLLQALAYSGAANFALFVALTPGAIGFREAFLAFSRQLHHISAGGILAASVIDRSIYVVWLGILFVVVLSMHAGDRFKKAKRAADNIEG